MVKLRVLILSEPFPPFNPGGAGKFAGSLVESLSQYVDRIDVVCVYQGEDKLVSSRNVYIHYIHVMEYGWNVKAFKARYIAMFPKIMSLHNEVQFDLVHDVGGFLYAEIFRDFVLKTKIPSVTHLQITMKPYLECVGISAKFVDLFHNLQLLQCGVSDVVVVLSEAEKVYYEQFFNLARPKLTIIGNAVEPILLDFKSVQKWRSRYLEGNDVLLFVGGRISDPVKGADRAIAFAKALIKLGFKPSLIINDMGHEPTRQESGFIRSVGRLSSNQLYSLLAAMDIVLCPSRYEAFGLLALEAGHIGTHVFASNVGGHRDTVGKSIPGILLDDDVWESPSPRVISYLQKVLGAGRQHEMVTLPERFTINGGVKKVLEVYKENLGLIP